MLWCILRTPVYGVSPITVNERKTNDSCRVNVKEFLQPSDKSVKPIGTLRWMCGQDIGAGTTYQSGTMPRG